MFSITNPAPGGRCFTSDSRAANFIAIGWAFQSDTKEITFYATEQRQEFTAEVQVRIETGGDYDKAAHSGILRQYQAHSIFAGEIDRLALPA